MRLIALTALLTLGVVAGCGRGTGFGPGELPAGRAFVSTGVTGHTLVSGTRIEIRFTADTVQAHAGCNNLSGNARFRDGRLVVDSMGQTEMACDPKLMDQDTWLVDFLAGEPQIRLIGAELVLTGADTEIRLKDRKSMSDKPLTGTRWALDTIVAGDTASSVPSGAKPWIRFDKNGLATGNAGCNEFGGTPGQGNYRVEDDTITFHDVASTQMSCGKERDAVERTVLGVLHGRVTYRIDAGVLVVTHPSGTELQFRAG